MAVFPCDTVRDISVTTFVSSALVSVESVGSVGAEAWAAPGVVVYVLKLALAAAGKFVCMSLADPNDTLDLGDQIVALVD